MEEQEVVDVVVIGGGQAALAVGWYLRRTSLSFVMLDAQPEPGGAWRHTWNSLRLFSPAEFSSLPGRRMWNEDGEYPARDGVIEYLRDYETHYTLPIMRPVRVDRVRREGDLLAVESEQSRWRTHAVVSATGTWEQPFIPVYPGADIFEGEQIHSANYHSPERFADKQIIVVGGGNSGAQILADLSEVAAVTWVTHDPPSMLPDHIDGRYLFNAASARHRAEQDGRDPGPPAGLGDIVMVEPVRRARDRGILVSRPPFERFTEHGVVWPDGNESRVDAVIWCTGFRPALRHLLSLGLLDDEGRIEVNGTRSVKEPQLWLVGYGNWTGFASATLIGVGRSAKATVAEIAASREG